MKRSKISIAAMLLNLQLFVIVFTQPKYIIDRFGKYNFKGGSL
jgi:hypothetical protein